MGHCSSLRNMQSLKGQLRQSYREARFVSPEQMPDAVREHLLNRALELIWRACAQASPDLATRKLLIIHYGPQKRTTAARSRGYRSRRTPSARASGNADPDPDPDRRLSFGIDHKATTPAGPPVPVSLRLFFLYRIEMRYCHEGNRSDHPEP